MDRIRKLRRFLIKRESITRTDYDGEIYNQMQYLYKCIILFGSLFGSMQYLDEHISRLNAEHIDVVFSNIGQVCRSHTCACVAEVLSCAWVEEVEADPSDPGSFPLDPLDPAGRACLDTATCDPCLSCKRERERESCFISKFIKMFGHELSALGDSTACQQNLMGPNPFVNPSRPLPLMGPGGNPFIIIIIPRPPRNPRSIRPPLPRIFPPRPLRIHKQLTVTRTTNESSLQ